MKIFLIGYMGSGKSTLGRRIANRMGFDFVDMDPTIEAAEKETIADIFKNRGEEAFRVLEHELIKTFKDIPKAIISTGGGAPCFHDNLNLMNETGRTIYLRLSPAALVKRLIHSKNVRPLVIGKSEDELKQFIHKHILEREKYYNMASIVVEGQDPDLDDLVSKIKDLD